MSLPTSRNRTYSVGSPVLAADMNDFQDQIIATYAGKRVPLIRKIPLLAGRALGTMVVAFSTFGVVTHSSGNDTFAVPLDVRVGERLTQFRARVDPSATATVGLQINRVTDGANTSLGSVNSVGALLQTMTLTVSDVVADNPAVLYIAHFSFATASGSQIFAGDYTVDFP